MRDRISLCRVVRLAALVHSVMVTRIQAAEAMFTASAKLLVNTFAVSSAVVLQFCSLLQSTVSHPLTPWVNWAQI